MKTLIAFWQLLVTLPLLIVSTVGIIFFAELPTWVWVTFYGYLLSLTSAFLLSIGYEIGKG